MGLDMYLTKKIYVGAQYEHRHITGTIELYKGEKQKPIKVNVKKVTEISEECIYWRKVNAIHKWFVDNVQDGNDNCGEYYVSREKLKELLNVCKQVLDNHELAPKLLPTQDGFFFGSTNYDEWYFGDIEKTYLLLSAEDLDSNDNYDISYAYSSSW